MKDFFRLDLAKDAQFFQTPEGLLAGSLVLLLLGLFLKLLERVSRPNVAVLILSLIHI